MYRPQKDERLSWRTNLLKVITSAMHSRDLNLRPADPETTQLPLTATNQPPQLNMKPLWRKYKIIIKIAWFAIMLSSIIILIMRFQFGYWRNGETGSSQFEQRLLLEPRNNDCCQPVHRVITVAGCQYINAIFRASQFGSNCYRTPWRWQPLDTANELFPIAHSAYYLQLWKENVSGRDLQDCYVSRNSQRVWPSMACHNP